MDAYGGDRVSTGWLVMWECMCSDVCDEAADIPTTCPGHGRQRVMPPWRRPDKPMVRGHRCFRNCPTTPTPARTRDAAEIEEPK